MTAIIAPWAATAITSSRRLNIGCRDGVTRAMNLLQLIRAWAGNIEPALSACGESRDIMDERQFYNEKPETKNITLMCPACHKDDSYPIRWIVRTKKNELPRGA